MAHFVTLPMAKETADLLIQHVFRLNGLPEDIVSDRGPQFAAAFWREFYYWATGGHRQPVIGVPSAEQWPDVLLESGLGSDPPMHDGTGHCLLVVPPGVGGIRPQLIGKLSNWFVPVPVRLRVPSLIRN